ncbi:MAG: radical SAM protein [Verrucomicrobia bacterium]|nr:radical SAM protein [Verrucomicrobiota bacterium]
MIAIADLTRPAKAAPRTSRDWTHGPAGEPRGYIQPTLLKELWFHTGTTCNLRCPFCLEGSSPGDKRLGALTLADVRPFIEEARSLGVEQFSFTGGEPFVIPEFPAILHHALQHRPCLVLTNGTLPILNRMRDVAALRGQPHAVRFRISLDHANAEQHDAGRGAGNFDLALNALRTLHELGFGVSVARHRGKDEDVPAVDQQFQAVFRAAGIPENIPIVSFPEFLRPNSNGAVPVITEACMTTYHTPDSRAAFMCAYTKMVVKRDGHLRVYACTLVDDDPDYDLGGTLSASMQVRVMLKHHRCFSCFAYGASCSDPGGNPMNAHQSGVSPP